jgi:hypothetical protein
MIKKSGSNESGLLQNLNKSCGIQLRQLKKISATKSIGKIYQQMLEFCLLFFQSPHV